MDCRDERKVEVESKENVRGVARYKIFFVDASKNPPKGDEKKFLKIQDLTTF